MGSQGFTRIERLITLGIVGFRTALAAPNRGKYIEQERLRGALLNLKQELAFARSEAINRNATIYISATDGASWCVGMSLQEDCDCSSSTPIQADACTLPVNGVPVIRRLSSDDYSGVTMDDDHEFSFDGIRGLASPSGSTTLSSDNYSGKAVVSILGRVKACGDVSGMEGC